MTEIQKIEKLFWDTRNDRLYYRSTQLKAHQIEGAACAIREKALLEALEILGIPHERIREMWKIK